MNASPNGNTAQIRRFDEIDTDSDFDFAPKRKATSFSDSLASEHHSAVKPVVANHETSSDAADSSVIFEPLPERKSVHEPKAATNSSEEKQTVENLVVPSAPPISTHDIQVDQNIEAPMTKPQLPTVDSSLSDAGLRNGNGREVKSIAAHQNSETNDEHNRLPYTPIPRKDPIRSSNDLLVKARLRLEEKRRSDMFSTPNQGQKSRVSAPDTSEVFFTQSPRSQPVVSTSSTDGVMRRLAAENNRLHDEVAFLTRENNRYRSSTKHIDSTDQMKLQITVEMMKKELCEKEESFLEALQNLAAERDGMVCQLQESIEQSEGYAAAAAQYEKLYNEKIKDLQSLSSKYQVLRQEMDLCEGKRRATEKNQMERLEIEISKAEKYKDLLDDAKEQRCHVQQLCVQLQQEVENLTRRNRELQEVAANAHELTRKSKAECEDKVAALHREIETLKDIGSQRQSTHAAELREERRLYDVLQQSLKRLSEESKDEVNSLRKSMDELREEHKHALREERQKRLEVEGKLQRLELSSQRTTKIDGGASSKVLVEDLEQRLRTYRDDLADAKRQREDAIRKADQLKEEVISLKDTLSYYQDELQALTNSFEKSEEAREEAERQNKVLSSTIEDFIHNDEIQSEKIEQLQEELRQYRSLRSAPEKNISTEIETHILAAENERLTEECNRLAVERGNLIEENGKIAAELLNWKNEMRHFASTLHRK